jgi:hypothetical protein
MLRWALYRLVVELVANLESLWLVEWIVFNLGSIWASLVVRMELLRMRVEGEGGSTVYPSDPFLGTG